MDTAGTAYLGGYTASTDFPVTPGAFQTTARGYREGFVAWITHATPASTAPAKVTGGGSIAVGTGRGTFGFVVQRKNEGGAVKGHLEYIDHATRTRITARTFTSLAVASTEATFEGACTINGSPCTFVVTVADRSASGARDMFTISVASAQPQGGPLLGGNIGIHE